jgi:hypothetical protein
MQKHKYTYNRTGSLFQEHFARNRMKNEAYLKQLIVYVHLNPVKHKSTKSFKTYLHSSYRSYLSNKESNIDKFYSRIVWRQTILKGYHDEKD